MDWAGLMRAGLRELRLRPGEFWALTPAELLVMLGRDQDPQPMLRDRLEALASAFPDNPRGADGRAEEGE